MSLEHRYPCQGGAGFTLIETMVYLALYAVLMSGVMTALYALIESSARSDAAAFLESEGEFAAAKIDRALSQSVLITSAAGSSTSLSLVESDGSAIRFAQCGQSLCLGRGAYASRSLNDSSVRISSLSFSYAPGVSNPYAATSVSAQFTVSATTTDGHSLSRDFYLIRALGL